MPIPIFQNPILRNDASLESLGSVLYQEQNCLLRVIAQASIGLKRLRGIIKSYLVLLLIVVIIICLKCALTHKFCDMVISLQFAQIIIPLTNVLSSAKLDTFEQRRLAALRSHDFKLINRSETTNWDAVSLPRRPQETIFLEERDACPYWMSKMF